VGIGASAGGLEAFSDLLRQLPADTQLALVFISHLDPDHKSMLAELVKRQTSRPVIQVAGDMPVQCNHVYIIPPNRQMVISGRVLKLSPRAEGRERYLPVDTFFRSLAEDQKSNAIGVVLSGNASDGTLGLKAIKAEGGITFAQDQSAKFDGMPRTAIAAGVVDYVLPPHWIALELARLAHHPHLAPGASDKEELSEEPFTKILRMLLASTGIDFGQYKHPTIQRRMTRRMALHRIERPEEYADVPTAHRE